MHNDKIGKVKVFFPSDLEYLERIRNTPRAQMKTFEIDEKMKNGKLIILDDTEKFLKKNKNGKN